MITGQICGSQYHIKGFIMDSAPAQVVGNFSSFGCSMTIDDINTSFPSSAVTGHVIGGLIAGSGVQGFSNGLAAQYALGQNYSYEWNSTWNGGFFIGEKQLGMQLTMIAGNSILWPFAPPSQTAAATPSVGTIPAGTYTLAVTGVGFNGGETLISNTQAVTVNGSQNIQVNWSSGVANVQGYNVYAGTGGAAGNKQNSSPIQALTFTFASLSNNGSPPNANTTGSPNLYPGVIEAPILRLTNGALSLFKMDSSLPTLTANRTLSYGDGAGSVVVSATLTTTGATSDNVAVQGATSSSHCQLTPGNASAATNIATTFISANAANQVTVTHTATASMVYFVSCSVN
jgi:hypothetical protein